MPKVSVNVHSQHPVAETFEKLKTFFNTDKDLRRMDESYTCRFDDKGFTGSAKGSKFEASMQVVDQGGNSQIAIEVSLPLMLTPFKSMVKETLEKKLAKLLA